jgi:hypothetical protein
MAAGYSGTPLFKKLGFKENQRVLLINEPENYFQILGELPEGIMFLKEPDGEFDIIHAFVRERAVLKTLLPQLQLLLKPRGMIWISWLKKSAKIPSDITEDVIRDEALTLGLVDIKVCAVDEIWSGLKLVIRKI